MASNTILDCEGRSLDRMSKFQLPNSFKKIGTGIAILSFLFLLLNKFVMDQEIFRIIGRYGILLGLLFVSLSKEKIEDELIASLRMQSYTLAFIAGVLVAMVQPAINFLVDYLIDSEVPAFKYSGDFVILFTLLIVQIFYFKSLKRMYK